MVFNYSFQTLSPEDKALRRQTLDHHALVTFLSCSVAPLGAVVLVRLARLLLARLPALLDGRGRESYKALGSPAVTDWQPGHGRSESAVSTATDLGFACELNGDGDGEVGGADSGGGSGSGGSGSGRGRVGGASRASVSAGTPRSRKFNGRRPSASLATILDTRLRQIRWWLRQGVQIRGYDCGARFQWVFGILWTVWLVFQCLVATGDDYLHLTKRFGIIAVALLPTQFSLAFKNPILNPFSLVFRTSHEQLNAWHRVLGTQVYCLFVCHAAFYLRYFVGVGTFPQRLLAPVVTAGVIAFILMTILIATSLPSVIRRWSYRVFFVLHLLAIFGVPVLIFIHARPARFYLVAALAPFCFDLISRKMSLSTTCRSRVRRIPGTDLLTVTARVADVTHFRRFRKYPGAHVYLSIPVVSRGPIDAASVKYELIYSPFTIAATNDATSEILLVVRHCGGPITKLLGRFAAEAETADNANGSNGSKAHGSDLLVGNSGTAFSSAEFFDAAASEPGTVKLTLEGAYGAAGYLPPLADPLRFDRVLLVAGGVGATFCLPVYRHIVAESAGCVRAELHWAVRTAGDATWALTETWEDENTATGRGGGVGNGKARAPVSLMDDDNVHVYITGDMLATDAPIRGAAAASKQPLLPLGGERRSIANSNGAAGSSSGGEVELNTMYSNPRRGGAYTSQHNRRRPDLRRIVDSALACDEDDDDGHQQSVAVLVCGPKGMVEGLRAAVDPWIRRGRRVFWHEEAFQV